MKPRKPVERTLLDFSKLGFGDVLMMGHYCYDRAHPPLKPHLHWDIYEICVLQQGQQTYFVGSQRHDLVSGDVFITKPGEVHGTGAEPENKGQLYWLEMQVSPSNPPVLGLPMEESRLLINRLADLRTRHIRHGEILLFTMERIFKVFPDTGNPFRTTELRNLLVRFFLDLFALAKPRGKHFPIPSVGVERALNYIEDHLTEAISLATLARQAQMSDSYFKKCFHSHTGLPPIEYVVQRRIELAKQRLRGTDQSITRLAMELGFATSQHFATVFKRATGKTPRAFSRSSTRRAIRAAPQIGAGIGFHPVNNIL